MSDQLLLLPMGQRISLLGHFDVPVVLEAAWVPGSGGYEYRVRLPRGSLAETVISVVEATELSRMDRTPTTKVAPVDAEKPELLVESARIHLAYAHDQQFADSLSGTRTLPHQVETVYQRMLPQLRLRFLLAYNPGAGKTVTGGLRTKEMKPRNAIERALILCPAPHDEVVIDGGS